MFSSRAGNLVENRPMEAGSEENQVVLMHDQNKRRCASTQPCEQRRSYAMMVRPSLEARVNTR